MPEIKTSNELARLAYIQANRDDFRAQNVTFGVLSKSCVDILSKLTAKPQWTDTVLGRRYLSPCVNLDITSPCMDGLEGFLKVLLACGIVFLLMLASASGATFTQTFGSVKKYHKQ